MIVTFTGWIEVFPTWTEKAEEVLKKLLHDIILRFGLPRSLQSDNGTSFTPRSPKGSLKHWALLIISLVPGSSVFRKSRKSQPVLKISNEKDNPGDLPGMEGGFTNSSPLHSYWRRQWHPTPVLLPGKSQGRRNLGRLQSMGSLRVGHD